MFVTSANEHSIVHIVFDSGILKISNDEHFFSPLPEDGTVDMDNIDPVGIVQWYEHLFLSQLF